MNSQDQTSERTAPGCPENTPHFPPLSFALLLLVFICVAFRGVIFGGETFCFRDFGLFGYPLAFYHRESFWNGEVPLWNPLSGCGMPFLAQWNTLVLYPGSFIYLLLPITWSVTAFCLAHFFLAGMTMYALALRWTGNPFAAAVAGMGFVFNGLMLNCLMWPNNIAAFAWMPLVVLLVERAWRSGGRNIAWAALVGGLQMLTGAPEIILFTWIVLAVLAATQLISNPAPRSAIALRFCFVVLLVAGLAAAQLLPFVDLLRHSQRAGNADTSTWAMPATGWANLLVPLFRTFTIAQGVAFQPGQTWTSSYYPGVGVLALAIFAAWQIRRDRVWTLAGITAFGLVMALGHAGGLYALVAKILPLGFMRYPIKFVVLAIFALPLLAAFAVQGISSATPDNQRHFFRRAAILSAVLVALIGVISWCSHYFPGPGQKDAVSLAYALSRILFLLLVLGALWFAIRSSNPRLRRLAQGLCVAFIGLDTLTHAPNQNPTVPRAILEPGLPPLRQLNPQPRPGESRAALTFETSAKLQTTFLPSLANDYTMARLALHSDCNLVDGIPKIGGFFSLFLPKTFDVVLADFNAKNELSGLRDFMCVSQISRRGAVGQWSSRPNFLPMVTAGQSPVFASDEVVLKRLSAPDFDPTRVVYLTPEAHALGVPTNAATISVETTKVSNHQISIQVHAEQPGWVVISQAYYHPWKATVDNLPATIHRANHGFQAVHVQPGAHQIRLAYRDNYFRAGCAISLGTLFIFLWLATRRRPPVTATP